MPYAKQKTIISKGPLANCKATLDTYNCGRGHATVTQSARQLAEYRKEPDDAKES